MEGCCFFSFCCQVSSCPLEEASPTHPESRYRLAHSERSRKPSEKGDYFLEVPRPAAGATAGPSQAACLQSGARPAASHLLHPWQQTCPGVSPAIHPRSISPGGYCRALQHLNHVSSQKFPASLAVLQLLTPLPPFLLKINIFKACRLMTVPE